MKLRQLNRTGVHEFRQFIETFDIDNPSTPPVAALTDVDMTEALPGVDLDISSGVFGSRYEAGKYLFELFEEFTIPSVDTNVGLWSWLALFYFKELCPFGTAPGEVARWVLLADEWKRYYRHLLASPYRIYKFNSDRPERAMALLAGPVNKPGELMGQFASRKEIITNRPLLEAINQLYWDANKKEIKRGAAGKGPGSARNLASVLDEYDLTWDFAAMTPHQIIAMLPPQYDRFRA